ncbi:MAG: dihydrolipoyl dehydrogenase [Planctomycetaceae bacterium]|nr:dihydrolipoyl dehydrogenase [Planctomycetaceae bacterium]
MSMHTQVAVLGGGPGGYAAAFMAADLGLEVTLIEVDARLGGTCLLRGCIPSKALLHVARVIEETHEMAQWGLEFNSPTVDLGVLRARKDKVIENAANGLKMLAKQRKVNVIRARGVFADSHTLVLESQADSGAEVPQLTFDHCILAVGSSPTVIPAFKLPTDRVMDSTKALALQEVPDSLLVIGGGYIGLELGTVYAHLGSKVTVVELTGGLLPGADRDLVRPLAARLEKLFTSIQLNTKVAGLADKGDAIEATLEGPEGSSTRRYSRVLVSVGRRPNSKGIGLENTKVKLTEQGFVVTDEKQQTHDPAIYAIGDISGEPMLAHRASHQGKIAAEAIAGEAAAFDPLAIPAVVFTDPEIAWAGLTEEQAKREGHTYDVARYPWAASGRAQSIGRTEGLTKILFDPDTERVLGVGIVGAGAGELIAEGVLAIEMACTARDLAATIHPHPTLSETISFAAETQLGMATEIYRPKR